jgi:long-chain fatty acid transport protein
MKRSLIGTWRWLLTTITLGGLALGVLAPGQVRAAGFLIYEMSAEALGKGSAVAASTREPAAVWFNPAALTEQGHGVSLGGMLVLAKSRFEPADPGAAESETDMGKFVLPTVFGTVKVHDRVALAFGVFPAFAIGIEWPEDWIGREHAIKAAVQTVNMNPTVAVRLLPELSLGIGFQAVRGSVEFINGLPAAVGGTAQLGGGTWGFGANAGLLYQPIPGKLGLALTYRSRVELDFDGRVDFDPAEPDFNATLVDQGGSASLTLPDILTFGIAGQVAPTLALTFDVNYTFWSTYDELLIDFERPQTPDRRMLRNNDNSFTLRLGADWTMPVEGLSLRAGLILDQNPSPKETLAPSLPDANRLDFGLGAGYRKDWFKADVGYLLVWFLPSDSEGGTEGPVGTYRSIAHLLGLTLTASFH